MVRRREFIAGLGSAIACILSVDESTIREDLVAANPASTDENHTENNAAGLKPKVVVRDMRGSRPGERRPRGEQAQP